MQKIKNIHRAGKSSELENKIISLYNNDKRVDAIKLYRKEIGKGLKESKEDCDKIARYGVILKENLQIALTMAIKYQKKYEISNMGFGFKSGLVAGWEETLKDLNDNKQVYIKE